MCSSEPYVCIRTNMFLLASINCNNKLTVEVNKNKNNKNNKKSTNRVANSKKESTNKS